MIDLSLQAMRVLVTRPRPQAEHLSDAIREKGGFAIIVPLLEILPLPETQNIRDSIQSLDQYHKIIFISVPAVEYGVKVIDAWWPQRPVGVDWYAIGEATANALQQHDIVAYYHADGIDSEALADLPDFRRLSGQRILIIKGISGREKLHKTFSERGAHVDDLVVYERHSLEYPAGYLPQQLLDNRINVIVATSSQIVIHLQSLLNQSPDVDNLQQLMLLVPSLRVADDANTSGFSSITVSRGAGTAAILNTMIQLNDIV
ncbi:MAG: uroporphyrinogen-III synthase [Endozoicomonadaceae bacterium]|nr:uroporphyrinogen-III synthase [Endozoicomonadaceae bacterium]